MSTQMTRLNALMGLEEEEEEQPRQDSALMRMNSLLGLDMVIEVPEASDPETNPILALGAGVARGLLDPFSIVPAIGDTVEKLKQYGDDELASRIGYGLGFFLGFAVPAAPAWKAGGLIAKGAGLTQKALSTADKAADLTRAGKFVRGSAAGALLAVGRDADSFQEKAGQIALEAALGGVGDTVLEPALGALAARFGGKVNKQIEDVIQEAIKNKGVISERGVEAHARAMASLDNVFAETTKGPAVKSSPVVFRERETPLTRSAVQGTQYHGAQKGYKNIDLSRAGQLDGGDPDRTFWVPGYYTTESAEVAGGKGEWWADPKGWSEGYAAAQGHPLSTQRKLDRLKQKLEEAKTRDGAAFHAPGFVELDKTISSRNYSDPAFRDSQPLSYDGMFFQKWSELEASIKHDIDLHEKALEGLSPNVRPSRLKILNPFDAEGYSSKDEALGLLYRLEEVAVENELFDLSPGAKRSILGYLEKENDIPNRLLFGNLVSLVYGRKSLVGKAMKKEGYDGLTHIGGPRDPERGHRVWIAFDADQVYSAFGPANRAKLVGVTETNAVPAVEKVLPVSVGEGVAADVSGAPISNNITAKRLGLQIGLEELGLQNLAPGEIRVIPNLGGDTKALKKVLRGVPGLRSYSTKRGGETNFLVSFDDLDSKDVIAFQANGFIPGQEVLARGSKWIAVGRTKNGLKVAKAGEKDDIIPFSEAQFLPIATNLKGPKLKKSPSALFASFIEKHDVWPGQLVVGATGGPRIDKGFSEVFDEFAASEGVTGKARLQLKGYFIKKQKEALKEIDPDIVKVLEDLQTEARRHAALSPQDDFEKHLATKGLTYVYDFIDGKKVIKIKNTSAQVLATVPNRGAASLWAKSYDVDTPTLIKDFKSPIAEEILDGGSGVPPTQKPHTAGELSGDGTGSFTASPWLTFFQGLMPRSVYLQTIEHQLVQQLGDEAPRVWSDWFSPVQRSLAAYRNESARWLKGGRLEDGTPVKGLLKIVGGNDSKNIRKTHKEAVVDLIETPKAQWTEKAAELGLNEKEIEVARGIRELNGQLWERWVRDPDIDISYDDFVEDYFPHFRAKSDSEMGFSIENDLLAKGKKLKVNKKAIDFLSEFSRKGLLTKWEKDPFLVSANYIRSGLYKSHVKAAYDQAQAGIEDFVNNTPNTAELMQIKRSIAEYLKFVSHGAPEAWSAINTATNSVMKKLGIHLDETTQDKVVNTLVTMNYGAYMGFRPGLAVRNLSQLLLTTYPLLGARNLSYGIKASMGEGARDRALRAGAIIEGHMAAPYEDAVLLKQVANMSRGKGQDLELSKQAESMTRGLARTGVEAVRKAGHLGVRATEAGLNVSGFNKADEWMRTVTFLAQEHKALKAGNRFLQGVTDEEKFFQEAGLNFFGEGVKRSYMEKLRGVGNEAAAEWLGVEASHNTQWLYQLGAGPSMFSHGWGRLFGQYGTWPTWYASYLLRGLGPLARINSSSMQKKEAVLFLARNAAVNSAIVSTGAAMGLELSRWTGLSSLSWMGGPFVDWFVDARNIVSGVMPSGESTGPRNMSLSRYGLKDTGEGDDIANLPAFLPEPFEGRIGLGSDWQRKVKMLNFFGAYFPGYLALKDAQNVIEAGTPVDAIFEAFNLPRETIGHEWPEAKLK